MAIELVKEEVSGVSNDANRVLTCGLKIGGGIDQDPSKSPYNYPDNVRLYFWLFINTNWIHTCKIKSIFKTGHMNFS